MCTKNLKVVKKTVDYIQKWIQFKSELSVYVEKNKETTFFEFVIKSNKG